VQPAAHAAPGLGYAQATRQEAKQPSSLSFRYGLNEQFNKQTATVAAAASAAAAAAVAVAVVAAACGVRDQR